MPRTIIIAEIGECFNGSMENAKKLIFTAKNSGCDIAKFQTLDYENISGDDPERDWFLKIALTPEKIGRLLGYGKKAGIQVLFTPENIKTAGWLLEAGLNDVKIASSTMADAGLVGFINRNFRRVFVSTGMATLAEVKKAVLALGRIKELYVMHCVSEYPTGPLLKRRGLKALAPRDAHLNMMKILMRLYPGLNIGYSDHTDGILAPVAAVAAGARVIEKHITLDRKTPVKNYHSGGYYLGTDHVLSLEPAELAQMVKAIRLVEDMMGSMKWERTEGEKILKNFLRKRFSSR